jgi:hypothetical protein
MRGARVNLVNVDAITWQILRALVADEWLLIAAVFSNELERYAPACANTSTIAATFTRDFTTLQRS